MKNYLTILLFLFCFSSYGQLSTSFISPTAAANSLVGSGVTISNATYTGGVYLGYNEQLGQVSNGSSYFSFNDGIILTTGQFGFASSTNTSDNCGEQMLYTHSSYVDPDLAQLTPGTKDPAILEFDVTTTGSVLEFDFIFLSEEYLEYVGSQYNDVFGFFISGPGINGPYTNNAKNIALIPSTNDIVSINTVNNIQNSQYYINNWGQGYWGPGTLAYDGYTQSIKASCPVQCNQTYHLKIVIANVSDYFCDSGVILKKGSLRSDFQLGAISADVQPICEGQNMNITVQGDNNWTYTWNTIPVQSGVGLKNITVVADANITSYTVTVTHPSGCTLTKTITVLVHPQNNIAPTTNGVNNMGNFTYYMRAGAGSQSFTIPSFDNISERVFFDAQVTSSTLPNGANFTGNNAFKETATYTWSPTIADIGVHYISVRVKDNNQCNELSTDYVYKVKVICNYCPLEVYYEDRHPNNKPLPFETKAGQFIKAGTSVDPNQNDGTVETGTASILFQAGDAIDLEPGFTGGPNFTALIEPNTCITDCNDCCNNFSGFTHDVIPNFFTPNNDGYYDVWTVLDKQHPFCAFNAQQFNLIIKNRWGITVHAQSGGAAGYCCAFQSPSVSCPNPPCFPTPKSDVYWDGRINAGPPASNGTYYYVLEFKGCGSSQTFTGFITLLGSLSSNREVVNLDLSSLSEGERQDALMFVEGKELSIINYSENSNLEVYPNPSKSNINIMLNSNKVIKNGLLEIFDLANKLILTIVVNSNNIDVNVTNFAKGTYLIKLTEDKEVYHCKFVKE